jgi:hypothetical protein
MTDPPAPGPGKKHGTGYIQQHSHARLCGARSARITRAEFGEAVGGA